MVRLSLDIPAVQSRIALIFQTTTLILDSLDIHKIVYLRLAPRLSRMNRGKYVLDDRPAEEGQELVIREVRLNKSKNHHEVAQIVVAHYLTYGVCFL